MFPFSRLACTSDLATWLPSCAPPSLSCSQEELVIFWKKQYYQANKPHFQHNPGLRNMLVYGALASALQGVAFGFLPYTKDLETFIIVSYCLRLLAEAADVAVYVAVLAMVIAVFPESVASKMAICETFLGVGLCLGLRQIEVFAI